MAEHLSGEWVGVIERDGKEFVRVSFAEGWCDLPDRKLFNVEVLVDEDGGSFRVRDVHQFQVAGDGPDRELQGRVDASGSFHIWPVTQSAEDPNRAIGGAYRFSDGRELFVSAQGDDERTSWQTYYREAERLVRLYPVGDGPYVSERCELFEFSKNGLVLRDADGGRHSGSRVDLYAKEELVIPFEAGYKLVGSLLTPTRPGPHPLTILVHGAGPGYREDYLGFAEFFLRRGSAVYLYDKRGWGASTGEEVWSDVYELADDAETVITQLMTHPEIDLRRVGSCGYSNGGWVAPLAASRVEGVAHVIIFSGSGVSPARQEQIRRCGVAREVLGATEEQVALLARFWEQVFPFYATGEWTAELERVIDAVENDAGLQALPRHAGMPDGLQPVPPQRTRAEWRELGGRSPDLGFDPLPVFQALQARLLFVWGARDSVVPVEESREAVAAALRDREDVALLVAPDAGHQMFLIDEGITYQREIGDEIQKLRRVPRRYAPGVWEAITDWALGSG